MDKAIAWRAVEAWSSRTLPPPARPRLRDLLRATTREVWAADRALRKALVDAILAARVSEVAFCRNRTRGKALLVARFRALSEGAITGRVGELEERAAADEVLQQRYRGFIRAVRDLLDMESDEPARLLAEICLELSLAPPGRRVPWVRRP